MGAFVMGRVKAASEPSPADAVSDKQIRIKNETRRIRSELSSVPKDKLALAGPLIDNAAFLAVELGELRKIIEEKGCTEKYQNGREQWGEKESIHLKAYNAMMKTYSAALRQLTALCDKKSKTNETAKSKRGGKQSTEDIGLMSFIMAQPAVQVKPTRSRARKPSPSSSEKEVRK